MRALIAELDAWLERLYPAENNYLLDVESLAAPDVAFWAVREPDALIGCGALKRLSRLQGEIKRMYVRPTTRGRGAGRSLLATIEAEARAQGLVELLLETGVDQPEAIALYRSSGYVPCGPYGDYRAHPLNLYLRKTL